MGKLTITQEIGKPIKLISGGFHHQVTIKQIRGPFPEKGWEGCVTWEHTCPVRQIRRTYQKQSSEPATINVEGNFVTITMEPRDGYTSKAVVTIEADRSVEIRR